MPTMQSYLVSFPSNSFRSRSYTKKKTTTRCVSCGWCVVFLCPPPRKQKRKETNGHLLHCTSHALSCPSLSPDCTPNLKEEARIPRVPVSSEVNRRCETRKIHAVNKSSPRTALLCCAVLESGRAVPSVTSRGPERESPEERPVSDVPQQEESPELMGPGAL